MPSLIRMGSTKDLRQLLSPLSVMFRNYARDTTKINNWKSIQPKKQFFQDKGFECDPVSPSNMKTKQLTPSSTHSLCSKLPFSFSEAETIGLIMATADGCTGWLTSTHKIFCFSVWKADCSWPAFFCFQPKGISNYRLWLFHTNHKYWKNRGAR